MKIYNLIFVFLHILSIYVPINSHHLSEPSPHPKSIGN